MQNVTGLFFAFLVALCQGRSGDHRPHRGGSFTGGSGSANVSGHGQLRGSFVSVEPSIPRPGSPVHESSHGQPSYESGPSYGSATSAFHAGPSSSPPPSTFRQAHGRPTAKSVPRPPSPPSSHGQPPPSRQVPIPTVSDELPPGAETVTKITFTALPKAQESKLPATFATIVQRHRPDDADPSRTHRPAPIQTPEGTTKSNKRRAPSKYHARDHSAAIATSGDASTDNGESEGTAASSPVQYTAPAPHQQYRPGGYGPSNAAPRPNYTYPPPPSSQAQASPSYGSAPTHESRPQPGQYNQPSAPAPYEVPHTSQAVPYPAPPPSIPLYAAPPPAPDQPSVYAAQPAGYVSPVQYAVPQPVPQASAYSASRPGPGQSQQYPGPQPGPPQPQQYSPAVPAQQYQQPQPAPPRQYQHPQPAPTQQYQHPQHAPSQQYQHPQPAPPQQYQHPQPAPTQQYQHSGPAPTQPQQYQSQPAQQYQPQQPAPQQQYQPPQQLRSHQPSQPQQYQPPGPSVPQHYAPIPSQPAAAPAPANAPAYTPPQQPPPAIYSSAPIPLPAQAPPSNYGPPAGNTDHRPAQYGQSSSPQPPTYSAPAALQQLPYEVPQYQQQTVSAQQSYPQRHTSEQSYGQANNYPPSLPQPTGSLPQQPYQSPQQPQVPQQPYQSPQQPQVPQQYSGVPHQQSYSSGQPSSAPYATSSSTYAAPTPAPVSTYGSIPVPTQSYAPTPAPHSYLSPTYAPPTIQHANYPAPPAPQPQRPSPQPSAAGAPQSLPHGAYQSIPHSAGPINNRPTPNINVPAQLQHAGPQQQQTTGDNTLPRGPSYSSPPPGPAHSPYSPGSRGGGSGGGGSGGGNSGAYSSIPAAAQPAGSPFIPIQPAAQPAGSPFIPIQPAAQGQSAPASRYEGQSYGAPPSLPSPHLGPPPPSGNGEAEKAETTPTTSPRPTHTQSYTVRVPTDGSHIPSLFAAQSLGLSSLNPMDTQSHLMFPAGANTDATLLRHIDPAAFLAAQGGAGGLTQEQLLAAQMLLSGRLTPQQATAEHGEHDEAHNVQPSEIAREALSPAEILAQQNKASLPQGLSPAELLAFQNIGASHSMGGHHDGMSALNTLLAAQMKDIGKNELLARNPALLQTLLQGQTPKLSQVSVNNFFDGKFVPKQAQHDEHVQPQPTQPSSPVAPAQGGADISQLTQIIQDNPTLAESFLRDNPSLAGSLLQGAPNLGPPLPQGIQLPPRPEPAPRTTDDKDGRIVRYELHTDGRGTDSHRYITSNGIQAEEQSNIIPKGEGGLFSPDGIESGSLVKRGSFSWIAPDGKTYSVRYVADETGFHPEGDHLPKQHDSTVRRTRADSSAFRPSLPLEGNLSEGAVIRQVRSSSDDDIIHPEEAAATNDWVAITPPDESMAIETVSPEKSPIPVHEVSSSQHTTNEKSEENN